MVHHHTTQDTATKVVAITIEAITKEVDFRAELAIISKEEAINKEEAISMEGVINKVEVINKVAELEQSGLMID